MPKISVDTFYPDKEEVLDPETLGDGEFSHKLEINELSRISVRLLKIEARPWLKINKNQKSF